MILAFEEVELQGIEPWSREDECVRSTCLAHIHCRTKQGHEHPEFNRSCCYLDTAAQHSLAQFMLTTPLIHTRRTDVWAMMASTDLISG
ncbi:MAG: hypothetical protein OJF59_001609 [Cytophagales bacterium]|nr:MAG: hypothetical protein OJF59_001609 [Cytophagales bacterium]